VARWQCRWFGGWAVAAAKVVVKAKQEGTNTYVIQLPPSIDIRT
jgi:hypothetical protein